MVHRLSPCQAEGRNQPVAPGALSARAQPFSAGRGGVGRERPIPTGQAKRTCGGAAEPSRRSGGSGRSPRSSVELRRLGRASPDRPFIVTAPTSEVRRNRPVANQSSQPQGRAVVPQSSHSESGVAALRLPLDRPLGTAAAFSALWPMEVRRKRMVREERLRGTGQERWLLALQQGSANLASTHHGEGSRGGQVSNQNERDA